MSSPPSARAWIWRSAGAVGDRGDDREADAVPFEIAVAALVRSAPEGLEQLADVLGRNRWAAVGDAQGRGAGARLGAEVDPAAAQVVADGVVEEVRDQPLDEPRVAARRRGLERRRGAWARWLWSASAASVIAARSSGRRSSGPRWLRASVSSASITRSCSAPAASTRSQIARSESASACGSASATSIIARSSVSGVRSSCEAFATNRRWASNAACRRASRPSIVSPSSFSSSSGPVSASRSWRFSSEIWRAPLSSSAAGGARARPSASRAGPRRAP